VTPPPLLPAFSPHSCVTLRCDAAPTAPLSVSAAAYSPSVIRVTWRPPSQPRGPVDDIVYVVEWLSFNADGSRAEGRVETGSRPHKVVLRSRSLHTDSDLQRVLVSDLQPSRTYTIRVCITRRLFRLAYCKCKSLL